MHTYSGNQCTGDDRYALGRKCNTAVHVPNTCVPVPCQSRIFRSDVTCCGSKGKNDVDNWPRLQEADSAGKCDFQGRPWCRMSRTQ
jgi:hypothetical protein